MRSLSKRVKNRGFCYTAMIKTLTGMYAFKFKKKCDQNLIL